MARKSLSSMPESRRRGWAPLSRALPMTTGVDPLASNKGFWAQLLGVGDFYYELAVQVSPGGR
jgi:hypothetical protein